MHIAHTRRVVEEKLVVARIRIFRDDLQNALKLSVVVDSGGDTEGDQPIWWVLVQWKAAKPVKTLGLTVHLLFDTFNDQQNMVVLNRQPGDERRSLYFQAGDRTEQIVKF